MILIGGIIAGVYPLVADGGVDRLAVESSPARDAELRAPDPSLSVQEIREQRLAEDRDSQAPSDADLARARTEAQTDADTSAGEINTRVTDADKRKQERTQPTPTPTPSPAPTPRPSPQPTTPIPADCSGYSGNRAIGCALLEWAGFGLDQMDCLEKLWTKESGWRVEAANPSGAYGIPQALPGNKMAAYGDDWQTNPETQVKWGLQYIKGKYGTPCDGWAYFQANGWY